MASPDEAIVACRRAAIDNYRAQNEIDAPSSESTPPVSFAAGSQFGGQRLAYHTFCVNRAFRCLLALRNGPQI
jgi:hypothetical protein